MAIGSDLIRELLSDPRGFNERGSAYGLLQTYFDGSPIETLRPLIRSQDPLVQRAALFVVAELGRQACPLVDDVLALLSSGDRYLTYHAMEIAAVCCEGESAREFAHVVRQLESDDEVLRALSMRLMSRADPSQFDAACAVLGRSGSVSDVHDRGLKTLSAGDKVDPVFVSSMIRDSDPLVRRYGAIAAVRLVQSVPQLIDELALSDDPNLQALFRSELNLNAG